MTTHMGGATQGMRVGGMDSQFSEAGLPASFGNYRPPQNFDDDIDNMPPPTYTDAKSMNSFRSKPAEMPPQPPLSGAPGKSRQEPPGLFQSSAIPASTMQQGRPKDFLFQALLDSQGGVDQVASFNTPVVKERATGVTGEQVPIQQTRVDLKADADIGRYEGEVNAGVREGKGHCKYDNGNHYDGYWQQDRRHGNGQMNYASGASYDGEWNENERSGHGVMVYQDSSSYEGQWLRDLKHGYGCYTFASGAMYTGQWFEGKMHGQGTYTFADGQQYTGEFDRNLKSGFGSHKYLVGDTWDGVWVSDEPHGTGMYIFKSNGQKVETPFIAPSDQPPVAGKTYQGPRVLRKEDKLKIMQDGDEAALAARNMENEAAQISANARKLTTKILEDTATLLGLVEED